MRDDFYFSWKCLITLPKDYDVLLWVESWAWTQNCHKKFIKNSQNFQKLPQNHLKDHNFSKIHCLIFLCSITRASKKFFMKTRASKKASPHDESFFLCCFHLLSYFRNFLVFVSAQHLVLIFSSILFKKIFTSKIFRLFSLFFCVFHRDDNETKGRHEQRKKRNYQKSSNAKAVFN